MASDQELRILAALVADSDAPRKRIADDLKLSESSLSKQISSLEHRKIIGGFTVELNYRELGFSTHAISFVTLKDQGQIPALLEHLSKINEAIEIYTVLGDDDVYIRWLCRDNAHLMAVLKEVLSGPNIAHVKTTTLAEERKRERGPSLLKK